MFYLSKKSHSYKYFRKEVSLEVLWDFYGKGWSKVRAQNGGFGEHNSFKWGVINKNESNQCSSEYKYYKIQMGPWVDEMRWQTTGRFHDPQL